MYLKASSHSIFSPAKEAPQPNPTGPTGVPLFEEALGIVGTRLLKKYLGQVQVLDRKLETFNVQIAPDVRIAVSKSRPKLSKSRKVSVPGRPGLLRAACFLKKISLDKGHGLPLLTKVFLSTVLGAPDC